MFANGPGRSFPLRENAEKINRFLPRPIDPRRDSGLLSVTPMTKRLSQSLRSGSLWLAAAALVCWSVSAGPLLKAMPRNERHETRHEIDHLEDHWRTAILSGNLAAMDSLLADDYMAITPNGMLQSKDETLASLRNGKTHFRSIQFSDRKVRFYGTTALVTSRADVDATTPEGNLSGSYRYTRVYARDAKGEWRIVSFEASRIRAGDEHK